MTAPPPWSILQADPLERALCAADGAVESIGVALAVGDDAIEETLAVVPHAAVQLREGLGVTLRPLAVPEVDGLRDHVRQADREGQQPWHQVDAEQAEPEPHTAVAYAVASVDQTDQRLGCRQHRLVVGLVPASGCHEDPLRVGGEREAQKTGPALPFEPVRVVPVAAHAGLADSPRVEHQETVTAQCRLRLFRTIGGDDLEAGRY